MNTVGVPLGAVYIGRGSKWGNPFRIGIDGDRRTVVLKYVQWFRKKRALFEQLSELEGKDLVCFCAPLLCHGDFLLWLVQLRAGEREGWREGGVEWPIV